MKKKALHKSIVREILDSKTRFLSILGIILLGVCFYAGIKATGPDMINTADNYYNETNLMDTRILSTMGLTKDDLALLENNSEIKSIQASYSQDVSLVQANRVVRFYSYNEKAPSKINQYKIVEGRLPEKVNEIALDNLANIYGDYKIGDTFIIDGEQATLDKFERTDYQVVGFVNSPMFVENMGRGMTSVGKGSVDYFGVIPESQFKLEVYTDAYVTYQSKASEREQAYSDTYNKRVKAAKKTVEKTFKQRPEERLAAIKKEAEEPINKAKKELADGEQKWQEAQNQLIKGRADLLEGKQALTTAEATYYQKIQEGEAELAANSNKLNAGYSELAQQEQVLIAGKVTLDDSYNQLVAGEQELLKQGINPGTDIATLQGQISNLQQFSNLLTTISSDMLITAANTAEGEPIAVEKITQWSGSLATDFVDLSQLQEAINSLNGVPMMAETRPMVDQIASQVSAVSVQVSQQSAPLEQLISALATFQEGQRQYQVGKTTYEQGLIQIEEANVQLSQGEEALNQGYAQLAQAKVDGQNQLSEARTKLESAEAELIDGEKKLPEAKQKLVDGQKELADKEQELADLKAPEYFFFDRDDNPGYTEYYENSKRISSIATVFPVFFFLIAALVSLTTMTRMVDEKRGEIGTLKALGYSNWEISQKYIVYATAASLIGAGLGLLIGFNVFPKVIINAYGALYNLPEAMITYYASYSFQSLLVALLCTLISAMVVLRYDLFSTPAILMRPKAPKAGQRIFLERLTFIWKRLNFNQKVTARNLFRYKQRMFMTVFGIAGCMALIITGFGLRDSISDVVDIQFSKLWHYQGVVTYNEEATEKDTKNYEQEVVKVAELDERLVLSQQSMRLMKKGQTTQTVTLDVPQNVDNLTKFVLFNDRKSGETYTINDEGAIINEKLAKMFDLKVGDHFKLTNSDNQKFEVKIAQVVENYAMHFVYMTPVYYQKVFNEQPDYNSELLLFKNDLSKKAENQLSEKLLKNDKVINVSFLSQTSSAMDDTIDSLNIVVWVLIISAATLAFIVLYNLTNINVSERIRELSTIKVLGFYDNEVTMYVYRENNILTALGILVGCVIGKLLHGFVLQTAEVDMLMFSPTIHGLSYVYSGLLTLFFSLIVMLVMHRKLRKVDMIEALKSTE